MQQGDCAAISYCTGGINRVNVDVVTAEGGVRHELCRRAGVHAGDRSGRQHPGRYNLAKNDVIDEIYARIFAAGPDPDQG